MNLLQTITINSGLLLYLAIAVIGLLTYFILKNAQLKNQIHKNDISIIQKENLVKEKDLLIEKIQAEIRGTAQDMAKVIFEDWKTSELKQYQKIIEDAGVETAQSLLTQWKVEYEKLIRKDAANRSVRVVLGRVTENLVPFTETFKFNPRDTRFIGNPIDLIVFDGVDENADEIFIWFIEVKTGTSGLSQKQKKIRDAIKKGRVDWDIISLKDFGDSVNEELNNDSLI
ncbi:MAG TPA: Holliday junction resolvase-like protein [Hanamia sp.]|nr:Holliday junction resolvase-like protein [Hanamia sp.]